MAYYYMLKYKNIVFRDEFENREHNQIRPHSALRYRPPAPEAKLSLTLT
jgi:hypothetical protein